MIVSKKIGILFFFIVVFISSCRDKIDIEIPSDAAGKLVVDGEFYTGSFAIVDLTISKKFNDQTAFVPPSSSIVSLTDGSLSETLTESPVGSGHFVGSVLKGDSSKEYTLQIQWNGTTYTSTNKFPRSGSPIDSAWSEVITQIPATEKDRYLLFFNVQERSGTGDKYLFRFYRNDSIDQSPNTIDIRDDQFVDGNYLYGVNATQLFAKGDSIRIEIHSVSADCYQFYYEIQNNTVNQNGLFTPPPAPIKGNISNGALGFFRLSWKTAFNMVVM